MLSVSSRYIFRVPFNIRAASTRAVPRGLDAIMQRNPDDVVITFAKRTAVGKAKKGQLKDIPVDEMLQALLKVSYSQSVATIQDLAVFRQPWRKPNLIHLRLATSALVGYCRPLHKLALS